MAKVTPASTQLIIAVLVLIYVFLYGTASVDDPDNHPVEEIENNRAASPKSRAIHDFFTYTSAYKTLDSKDTKCYLERMHQKVDAVPKKDIHRVLFTTHKLLTKQEVWVLGGPRISEFCKAIPTFLLQHRNAYWQREEQVIAYKTLEDAKCFIMNLSLGKSFDPLNNTNFTVSSSVKLSKQALWNFGGSKIVEFCNGFTSYALQQDYDTTQVNMISNIPEPKNNKLRRIVKRNAPNSNNYKLKSQTQSQYLNIAGTGQEPGKAEAEASREGTKAVVIGSSGMGQAQSQSGPWSCSDCYGQDGEYPQGPDGRIQDMSGYRRPGQTDGIPGTERRPGEIGAPYTQPGRPGIIGQFGPSGLRPGEQIYPIRPGDYGRPGGDTGPRQPGQQESNGSGRQGFTRTDVVPGSMIGSPGSYQRPGTAGDQTLGAPEFPGTYGGPGEIASPGVYGIVPGSVHQGQRGTPARITPGTYGQPDILKLPGIYRGQSGVESLGAYGIPGLVQQGQPGTSVGLPQVIPGTHGQPVLYVGQGGVALPGIYSRPGAIQQGQPGTPGELPHIIPGTSSQPGTSQFPGTYAGPAGAESPGIVPGRPGTVLPGQLGIPGGLLQLTPGTYGQQDIPRFPGAYSDPRGFQPGRPGTPGLYQESGGHIPTRLPGIFDGGSERPGSIHTGKPDIYESPGAPAIYSAPGTYVQGQPGDPIISQPGIPGTYYPSGSIIYQKGTMFGTPGIPGVTYVPGLGDISHPQRPTTSGQQGTYQPDISGPGVGIQYPGGASTVYPQGSRSVIPLPDAQFPGSIGQTSTGGYDQSGEFRGKVSGDYHASGQKGQFSGLISGQYSGRGRTITGLTGTGPSGTEQGTGPSGIGYPPEQGKYLGQEDDRGAEKYFPTQYPGMKPSQTYGQDIIYPTGPNGRPGISTHPDHQLLPGAQYPSRGVSIPGQIYQPRREHLLIPGVHHPGQEYGSREIVRQPASVITGAPSAYYPGEITRPAVLGGPHDYIPSQGSSVAYTPGQDPRGTSSGGVSGPGPSGIGPSGGYISGQGPIGSTGTSAKVPTYIARPSEYIPGQGPSGIGPTGGYISSQGPIGGSGTSAKVPTHIARPSEYIPGQGPSGIGPTGGYISGQGPIGGSGTSAKVPTHVARPSEYISGQGPSGSRSTEYIPGQAITGIGMRPGGIAYIPDRGSQIYVPGQGGRPGISLLGTLIPGDLGFYIPGQSSIQTPGLAPGTSGEYIPGQGPSGIGPTGGYISGQGPIGSTGTSAKVPTHIARPSEYISGQGPSGSRPTEYIPGQAITGIGMRPGGITYIPDRGSQIYVPGQDRRPGISVPGTQIPGGLVTDSYTPGQSLIQTPGLAPGTSGEYIPGQRPIGPSGIMRPVDQYPGQISISRPGDGYYRPGQVLLPGERKPDSPEVPTGISYRPGESNDAGRYYGKPGDTYLQSGIGETPSGLIRPGDYSGAQPEAGPYTYPGERIGRPGQLELLPGSPRYIPGSATPEDDSDSQVQTSVQQLNNETQASASSQGKFLGGTAQSQVSGTYSGSGAFSASAGTIDQYRGAQTQVAGGAEGGMSSAQGRGGTGQSQAQIQLSSKTGDTTSSAQSGGVNHGTNTQVQAGGKGGMADSQANGKGSTSSQANIGFSPYDANEGGENGSNGNRTPFGGGGTASAQSGSNAGQSQAQINGKYRFGIKYTGSAQASSSNDGKTFPLRNDSTSQTQDFKLFDFNKPLSTFPTTSTTQTPVNITTPRVSTSHNKRSGAVDYSEEEDEPDEEYAEDYIETESKKKVIIPINSQHTRAQRQHVSLGRLEDLDATIIQTTHKDAVYQPGQMVPGTEFAIPSGLRGRVLSTSGQETYSQGSNSQAQTIHLNPGTGQVTYVNPPIYAVTSNTHLRNGEGYGSGYTYQPQYQLINGQSYPRFVSSTKSETGSKNVVTGKKTPSVYYSQSSTCGYFTNNCVFSNGRKVCIPKPKLNPDGTPMIC